MAGPRRSLVRVLIPVALALAVAAGLALALAGLGHRWGWWGYKTGFLVMGLSVVAAALASAGALTGLVLALRQHRPGLALLAAVAVVVAGAGLWLPYSFVRTARGLPPIHDVSTDLEQPPAFVAVLARRPPGANPTDRATPGLAAQQRAGYPDLGPVDLPVPAERATDRAVAAARGLGWELVAAVPAEGRLEATATTAWWGFRDDVVVRVTPTAGGSRVDVRSVSRVGRSDLGANAARIRAFQTALRN